METDILIVGAGPVGLTLALILVKSGVNFRIIDQEPTWSNQSRAITLSTRTLEELQTLGLTEQLIKEGIPCYGINYYYKSHFVSRTDFTPLNSHYNFLLQIPQSTITRILTEKLQQSGVRVERPIAFVSYKKTDAGFVNTIKNPKTDMELTINSNYLIACDGARSTIRKHEGMDFTGDVHGDTFLMTDVVMKNFPFQFNERHYFMLPGKAIFAVLPLTQLGEEHVYRIITIYAYQTSYTEEEVLNELKKTFNAIGLKQIEFIRTLWTTNFNPKQFLVSQFYHDHLAYVGDAAHIQSPIGAQGLNTGIQDAFNIGWKLIFILKYGFQEQLLKTYHDERHEVANKLFHYNEQQRILFFRQSLVKKLINLFSRTLDFSKKRNQMEIEAASQLNLFYPKNNQKVQKNYYIKPGHLFPDTRLKLNSINTIYDILTPDHFLLIVFDNKEAIEAEIQAMSSYSKFTKILVISRNLLEYPNIIIVEDKQGIIHHQFDIKEKTACLIRPDTYIELVSFGKSISMDLKTYFDTRL